MHKAGFVNIIGNPNVGKSTLMNHLVGERLSIITAKAQTTRHRILGIVNEDDFIIALSTNVIAGAGLDVYDKEPLPESHKLRFVQNALLLPHIGYVTAENYATFYTQMIENLDGFVSGKLKRVIE